MGQDGEPLYRFRLHRCGCDDHYHIIAGPGSVSWPFWSVETGLDLINMIRMQCVSSGCSRRMERHYEAQLQRIKEELFALSRIRNRNDAGQFEHGFKMPKDALGLQERLIGENWLLFQTHDRAGMYYLAEREGTIQEVPLFCEFVRRPDAEIPQVMGKESSIAYVPARFVWPKELGIEIPDISNLN